MKTATPNVSAAKGEAPHEKGVPGEKGSIEKELPPVSALVAKAEDRILGAVRLLEEKLAALPLPSIGSLVTAVTRLVEKPPVTAPATQPSARPAAPPATKETPQPAVFTGETKADLEEVTASFRRALGEAIDRKLEEVMAPAVGLYQRLAEEAKALEKDPDSFQQKELRGLLADTIAELENILRLLGGGFITPKVGEYYDPLIHLAVGEAPLSRGSTQGDGPAKGGEAAGIVAQVVQPGYKSGRGRVVLPARVLVGRR